MMQSSSSSTFEGTIDFIMKGKIKNIIQNTKNGAGYPPIWYNGIAKIGPKHNPIPVDASRHPHTNSTWLGYIKERIE